MNIIKNIITLLYTEFFHESFFKKKSGYIIQIGTNKYQKQSFTILYIHNMYITYLVKEEEKEKKKKKKKKTEMFKRIP